ncbi:homoserine dehydrogenase [Kocuria marina]|uniref:homoserine dehydrogenase n=1 Tax=Kocuria marina TaxID=223184 RepID=UPI0022E3E7DC|nr:homoserine dehydrogenase [Kocuria marina]
MNTSPATDRETPVLKVGLLGAGTVGSQVARVLLNHAHELALRSGVCLELSGVAVRNPQAPRDTELPAELLTTDVDAVIDAADVVVELTGGIEPTRTRVLRALNAGKSVITGNKALLAEHGRELHDAAAASGAQLSYEAAVAGAIPIVRPMRDSLAGDRVNRFLGIMNGTTNFILDQMDTTGAAFDDALAQAQELGYAEADPTADVEGHDAAAKAAVLASLAFHSTYTIADVHCEGITGITAQDVAAAREAGYVIKLLSVGERCGDGVNLRVNPVMIPRDHVLAGVHGAYNAVFVEAANAGSLMFYGQGAGGDPTASAVLGDLVSAARAIALGAQGIPLDAYAALPAVSMDDVTTRLSITVAVTDRLGVLAQLAQVFADHGVSISTMLQIEDPDAPGMSQLRLVTHSGRHASLMATVAALRELDVVRDIVSVTPVEAGE